EDHIGAIPYLLKQLSIPIYGGALTIGLVKAKLEEHKLLHQAEMHIIQGDEKISFQRLHVHFFRTTHSIPDAFGIVVDTPYGSIIHTGDFKFDFTPQGIQADFHKILGTSEHGVLALLSDSTNSEREGQSPSEQAVGLSILESFRECTGRILFATFASNVHRLQQVVNAALQCNRKIAIVGRSMEKVFSIGQELGYIRVPSEVLIDLKKVNSFPDNEVLIICTGSQGEPNAALTRIASGSHRQIEIHPEDTVIFSSSPIPGNVLNVNRSINKLMFSGARVIYGSIFDIHTSGHGSREDLKLMLRLVQPKYFIPIHGEYRMLVHHKKLAEQVGIPSNHIFLLNIGEVLNITKKHARRGKKVPSGSIFIRQSEMVPNEAVLIQERTSLAQEGVVVVVAIIEKNTRQVLFGPDIVSRGFVYMKEAKPLLKSAEHEIKRRLSNLANEAEYDHSTWQKVMIQTLDKILYKKLGRSPIILTSIHEV
ncbi:MAG: ribonuclease J, partial [Paenibacillus sp.]|uniref:ribonuclease J n=1 Tax=Paenibacillus sp. TaxID=58172 RepID=UPI0029009A7C